MKNPYYAKRRSEFLSYLGEECVVCQATEDLNIDHIDHTLKSFSISDNWHLDWEILKEELDKCQLLCKRCHLDKTLAEGSLSKGPSNQKRLVHGSKWTHAHHKCRCDICVAAHGTGKKTPEHGTRARYLRRCRCDACKAANSKYSRDLRNRPRA